MESVVKVAAEMRPKFCSGHENKEELFAETLSSNKASSMRTTRHA